MPEGQPARYRWVWFFVILGVLTTGGIAANVWFNLRQQLTPEQLDEARRLWEKKGPADYWLDYKITREVNPDLARPAPQEFTVRVLNKKVVEVTRDGRSLQRSDMEFDSMDSLFAGIERQLRIDGDPSRPQAFVKAEFDGGDGHVTYYLHSVMRTRERLEVRVRLKREIARKE